MIMGLIGHKQVPQDIDTLSFRFCHRGLAGRNFNLLVTAVLLLNNNCLRNNHLKDSEDDSV